MEILEQFKNFHFRNELWVLLIPVSLMAFDFATGLVNAWIKRRVKSYIMRKGLGKKVGELSVLVIGEIFSYGLNIPHYIMDGLSLYIILMELISIFENLDKLRVPIPKFIKKGLGLIEQTINDADLTEDQKDAIIGKKKKKGGTSNEQ